MGRNRVVLDGRLLKRGAVRYTPAGVAALDFAIAHGSLQVEAEQERKVRFEIAAVALGAVAGKAAALKANQPVRVAGFMARRGANDPQLILHVTRIEADHDTE